MLNQNDWALIESRKERGVPLHVVLRAIEHEFDSYESKKHKRAVKTLLYCQEEVEAQYAEWLESRVGSHEVEDEKALAENNVAFPRQIVLDYLARSLDELSKRNEERLRGSDDDLTEALSRAI